MLTIRTTLHLTVQTKQDPKEYKQVTFAEHEDPLSYLGLEWAIEIMNNNPDLQHCWTVNQSFD